MFDVINLSVGKLKLTFMHLNFHLKYNTIEFTGRRETINVIVFHFITISRISKLSKVHDDIKCRYDFKCHHSILISENLAASGLLSLQFIMIVNQTAQLVSRNIKFA